MQIKSQVFSYLILFPSVDIDMDMYIDMKYVKEIGTFMQGR